MSHKKTSELKKRARLAKQRLRMGYWESVARREEEQSQQDDAVFAARRSVVLPVFDGENGVGSSRDEKMYKKVCEILDRDETTINPIGQLIDNELYSTLDAASKQRYILELSNKFRELKERYYRERTGA